MGRGYVTALVVLVVLVAQPPGQGQDPYPPLGSAKEKKEKKSPRSEEEKFLKEAQKALKPPKPPKSEEGKLLKEMQKALKAPKPPKTEEEKLRKEMEKAQKPPKPPKGTLEMTPFRRSFAPIPPPFSAARHPQDLPRWFVELDTDGDGQVSLREGRAGLSIAEFTAYDLNNDGFITPEEIRRYRR